MAIIQFPPGKLFQPATSVAARRADSIGSLLDGSMDKLIQSIDELSDVAEGGNALQRARHLSALLDAIPGAVIVLDPQGLVVEANESARKLLAEQIDQKSWRDIVEQTFLPELDQGELKTADGRQFSLSTQPLGYAPGQILLLSDVTQTRNLQRAAQKNLHLVTMGKMMASLAHQIRTPLSASMLYLSQIVEGNLDEVSRQKFSEKTLARVKHIEQLINDMLVFAHGGQFVTTRFTLRQLLDELQEHLQPQMQQRQARFDIVGKVPEVELQGNREALLGALGNLCMNALQATSGRQPLITIRVRVNRIGMLDLELKDNGEGMDRNTRKHIFDPFFSTKSDGTRLGLAVVKSVIESHQGRVAVYSRPGHGTRFRLFLPCQQTMNTQLSDSKIAAEGKSDG